MVRSHHTRIEPLMDFEASSGTWTLLILFPFSSEGIALPYLPTWYLPSHGQPNSACGRLNRSLGSAALANMA